MKTKRFSVEQIVAEVYGGLEPSQARKLKQLEEENAKLKRLVADLSLDKVMLQDVVEKSGETGGATRHGPLSPGKLRHQRASGLQCGGLPEIELPV